MIPEKPDYPEKPALPSPKKQQKPKTSITMKKLNPASLILLAAAAFGTMAASAESFTLKTGLPAGSELTLTLNAGLNVSLSWGDGSTSQFCSTGLPTTVNVADPSLTVTTDGTITQLYVNDNAIEELGLTGLKNLIVLDCNDNQLTSLALSRQTLLQTLWCARNQLTALDLSKLTVLEKLNASDNKLEDLKLNSTKITDLWIEGNALEGTLDLSKLTALFCLAADHNNLNKIDLNSETAAKKAMEHFYVNDNALFFNSFATVYDKSKEVYTIHSVITPQRPYFYTHGLLTNVQHDLSELIRYNAWNAAITPTVTLTDVETASVLEKNTDFTMSGSYKFTFTTEHRYVTATLTTALYPDVELSTQPFAVLADLSGITAPVVQTTQPAPTFDLQGRSVSASSTLKGIYIQNGKKIIF